MKNQSWRIVLVCVLVSSVAAGCTSWVLSEMRYKSMVAEMSDALKPIAKRIGLRVNPAPTTIGAVLEPFARVFQALGS